MYRHPSCAISLLPLTPTTAGQKWLYPCLTPPPTMVLQAGYLGRSPRTTTGNLRSSSPLLGRRTVGNDPTTFVAKDFTAEPIDVLTYMKQMRSRRSLNGHEAHRKYYRGK
ncbi:hypothetical protein F5141DRAFT_1141926 [Pisolithus sp. B1]|nr:hypothetical protein F5141DRAFT_1141926 [Pisolithus sp. B1]